MPMRSYDVMRGVVPPKRERINMGKRVLMNEVAFLCPDSMSAVAIAVPVITGFCKANPDVDVTVVVPSKWFYLFDYSGVQTCLPSGEGEFNDGLRGVFRLRGTFLAGEVDALIDFADTFYSRLLCKLLMPWQCKTVRVESGREGKKLLTRKYRKVFVQQKSTLQRYLDVLSELGVNITPLLPDRVDCPMDERVAELIAAKQGRWIGVAPFAATNGKTYPLRQTDRLIEFLCERGERVVLFGQGEYERQFGEAMEQRHGNVVSVVDRYDVRQELNMMSHMDVMVTMDSAPMHLAAMLGVKTVSVWGATHPYAGYAGMGQTERTMVQLDMACRPCSVRGTDHCMFGDFGCMKGIDPEMIVERVDELLAE